VLPSVVRVGSRSVELLTPSIADPCLEAQRRMWVTDPEQVRRASCLIRRGWWAVVSAEPRRRPETPASRPMCPR